MFMQTNSPIICPDYPDCLSDVPRKHFFSPYADNGGSVAAIAGDDFAIIGSDTRISTDFLIYTRNSCKLFPLTSSTILGCTGCWCDAITLAQTLHTRLYIYEQEHHKIISTTAAAQMLSIMLYYKRFFPYYLMSILAGLDDNGKGCIYSYDPLGHCERSEFEATGSAGALLQPLLDNQIGHKNMLKFDNTPLTLERALDILKDGFISAAERDIYTGDELVINIISKNGIDTETFDLPKD